MADQRANSSAPGEPIRVLQLLDKTAIRDASIHGVSRLVLRWWPAFLGTEIELSLCVLRSRDAAAPVFSAAGVEPEYLGRGKLDPRAVFDIARIVQRDRIDILHCHGYGASNFGRLLRLRFGIPVIVHEHFVDKSLPPYQRIIDRILAPATSSGLAVSNAVKEFLTGPRSVPRDRVQVLYNSVPKATARSSDPSGTSRGLRVGIVGRLDPVKGHVDFLAAAARVIQTVADAEFWIVGDGELATELKSMAERLGLVEQVRFLGHCDDVPQLLGELDLLVACSHSEGFSLAAAEAMAHGLAVVGTDVGGIPEVVESGVTGILVPPGAPELLADAIERLLANDELRRKMGERGRERADTHFSMGATISRLRDLYRTLASVR